jgi:hypothetical protein
MYDAEEFLAEQKMYWARLRLLAAEGALERLKSQVRETTQSLHACKQTPNEESLALIATAERLFKLEITAAAAELSRADGEFARIHQQLVDGQS